MGDCPRTSSKIISTQRDFNPGILACFLHYFFGSSINKIEVIGLGCVEDKKEVLVERVPTFCLLFMFQLAVY